MNGVSLRCTNDTPAPMTTQHDGDLDATMTDSRVADSLTPRRAAR
jgi:hypothetical protein